MRKIFRPSARTAALGLALVTTPLPLTAQPAPGGADGPAPDVHALPRVTVPIEIDGRVDEAAWESIEPLPLVTHQPVYGEAPATRTEIRVAYDDDHLYASGRFAAAPNSIQAPTLARDGRGPDDRFRIVLDTFGDRQNGVAFETTPAGVRTDFAVTDDGASIDMAWNTFWEAAAVRTEDGWHAEMRIPLSSLRYRIEDGRVTMALIASRFTAATNELATFPALPPSFANAPLRLSQASSVSMEGIEDRIPLYATPYALVGGDRTAELASDGDRFVHDAGATREAGFDLKAGLSSNLTLDVTLNTDFAQVEADAEQVNLTRFSLFFPEKRQFFLERAGLFSVATGALVDPSLFFHSRRIGLTGDGVPLRIWGGTRVVGRVGTWDVGLLDMQVEEPAGGGTENLGVARFRHRVLNEESTIGGMATSRVGVDGRTNVAGLADARLRLLADETLTVQAARSFDDRFDDPGIDASMVRVAWERPGTLTSQGLGYHLGAKWSGSAFRPGLGFQPRSGFQHYFINARYGFYPGGGVRSIQPSVVASLFRRNDGGSLDTFFGAFFLNVSTRSGALGYVGVSHVIEDLESPLPLSDDTTVPVGRHGATSLQAAVHPPPGDLFGVDAGLEIGQFFDGTRLSATLAPTWSVSEHLSLGAEYELTRVQFDARDEALAADIARLRIDGALDTRLSGSVFVQYNQVLDAVDANVRFRYHLAEGRDVFLVVNERMNVDRDRFDPRLPVSQERAVLIKTTWTFGD